MLLLMLLLLLLLLPTAVGQPTSEIQASNGEREKDCREDCLTSEYGLGLVGVLDSSDQIKVAVLAKMDL